MSFGIGSEQRAPSKSHHIVRTTPSRRAALYYRPRLMPSKISTTASTEAGAPIAIALSWACKILDHGSNAGTPAATNSSISLVTTTRSSKAAIAAMKRSGCPKVWPRFCPSTTMAFQRTMTSSVMARTRLVNNGRRVRSSHRWISARRPASSSCSIPNRISPNVTWVVKSRSPG